MGAVSGDEPRVTLPSSVLLVSLCIPGKDESVVVEISSELLTRLIPVLLSTAVGEEVVATPEMPELPRDSDCDSKF